MNAEEVARFLGCSSKTVRRHLEKGTITASRKASGELKISEDQVEKLRLVLELEDTSGRVQQKPPMGRPEQTDMSRQVETDIDLEQRLASMAQSIANLNATVANQTRRIGELAARVAQLEAQASLVAPVQPETSLYRYVADRIESGSHKPQKQHSDESSPIPSDLLSVRDFAAKIGMEYTILDGYARRGIRGERMDVTEVPHPTRQGYSHKYFNPEQQKKAIELLRKHGKLDTN